MKRHVLVTGGAGFIGSHLCERLLAEGHKVTCVDNLFSCQGTENIQHLLANRDFRFVEKDVAERIDYVHHVDEIYNLACPASPDFYQSDPIRTMTTCVSGALRVLELARHYNAKVLQASTSEIYGDPEVHPQVEDYRGSVSITGPRACYDEGKRAAEVMFFDYHRLYKTRIKVARIFNTYGPRMYINDGRVVSNFIVQALTGEPLTVYGDGSQTRSFCYVSDLVDGLVRLMDTRDDVTGPVNLGNPEEYAVGDIAEKVKDFSREFTKADSTIDYKPLPQDDPRRRKPDITKARSVLNWSPNVPLAEGLPKTIKYFAEHPDLASANKLFRPVSVKQ